MDALDMQAPAARGVLVLPVIEESLQVAKRTVDTECFRITKRVDSRDAVVDETLRRDQVNVERRPIGRLLEADLEPPPRQEGDTLVISVVEEVLVTEKRLMLKEEVRITRTRSIQHRPQTVSLRSEEVTVERLEP